MNTKPIATIPANVLPSPSVLATGPCLFVSQVRSIAVLTLSAPSTSSSDSMTNIRIVTAFTKVSKSISDSTNDNTSSIVTTVD